ncbi:MAG: SRPBCC family protein [Gulosibacter sp.]|uniref:SRPBCC family protein n=1 Tax=Gulosibacter sp. TaxID=2817531 RepID=UPI003F923C0D
MHSFVTTTRIAAPIERCFSLSLSIDAHTESMKQSTERAVAGVTSGEIGLGETVTWRARHFGIPFRMTSKISEYERPVRFVDQQIAGPFQHWWHEHEFLADGEATVMVDRIELKAPFGVLGRFVEWLILRRYMENLIRVRNEWLKQELEA